jgi:predicted PurR-regulated permease PerM
VTEADDAPAPDPASGGDADLSGEPPTGDDLGTPGKPFDRRAPYLYGLLFGLGALTAVLAGKVLITISSVLVEVVVAMFIAAGLNPLVTWLERRGLRRSLAVLTVIVAVLAVIALFIFALVPVITDQVTRIGDNAPTWLDRLEHNSKIQQLNDQYHVIDKFKTFITDGDFVSKIFGGVLGVGLAILGFILNALIVTVMTLYFLASYESSKKALYQLAPASRRDRVTKLGDRIFAGIGGYVSGAFIVALCAGLSSLVFLVVVGMGQYAVALAFVVMLTDVIPMIGATIGAVIVCAICFATDVRTGIIAVVFYILYQQIENYVIYPRVMSRSVDVPGVVTVIAALVGAALLGVVGALIAIPVAAAVLMLVREVWIRAQDQR